MLPITFAFKHIRYMQYLSAILAAISAASGAMYTSWASPSLPKLMVSSEESPIGIEITGGQASWLVSSVAIGITCGSCIKIICAEFIGRKTWLLLCGVFLAVPWLVMYFTKNLIVLYIARFIGGLGYAVAFTTTPIYIAEIAEKDIRGKLVTAVGVLTICGNLFIMIGGPFLSYFNLCLSCSVLPITFLILFSFMPESPYYLVKMGRPKAALKALRILSSGNSDDAFITKRLAEIEETVTYDMAYKGTIWEFVAKKEYRKSLIIMLGMKTLQQMCGIPVIDAYSQTIIARSNSSISSELSSILFGVIQVPAVLFSSFVVDKVGRRPLWILSALGCATALIGEGLCFYLSVAESLAWLPTACILLFLLMGPIGVGTLPYILLGEIFSTNIKGAAVSSALVYSAILGFIGLKYFEPVSEQFGMHTPFWIFAGFCLAGAIFVYFVIPETKGKSLEEIQQILNKNRKTRSIDKDIALKTVKS